MTLLSMPAQDARLFAAAMNMLGIRIHALTIFACTCQTLAIRGSFNTVTSQS